MKIRDFWLGRWVNFNVNGNGGGGGVPSDGAPGPGPSTAPSAPAAPAAQPTTPSQTPIDRAYDQMLRDDFDLPADPNQDAGWGYPQAQPQAQPAQPQYPQPVTPPGQQPAQQQVPPQPGVQPAPQAPPQAQPPGADPQAALQERVRSDPFGLQADMIQQQEQQYVQALAKSVYPVSQQDIDAFLSGDGNAISTALARVHVNAVGSMLRVVSQQMPYWVNNMLQLHTTSRDRESEFWTRNSFLDKQKHGKLALTSARAYRQANPQATPEEIDRMVGIMVAVQAGVALPQGYSTGQQAHQHPATQVRTPGPVVRQAPQAFSPAGTSAPGLPRRAPAGNQWTELAQILMADQAGGLDNVT